MEGVAAVAVGQRLLLIQLQGLQEVARQARAAIVGGLLLRNRYRRCIRFLRY